MTSLYVYALLPKGSRIPTDLRGFHQEPCEALPAGELTAVVAPQEGEAAVPTPEHVLAHHEVIVRLRDIGPALPVRFGTVIAGAQALQEAIAEQYTTLIADMDRLDGNVEYGITVLWGSGVKPASRPESTPARSASSGSEYMRRRLAEYRQEGALREAAESLKNEIQTQVGTVAIDAQFVLLPSENLPVRAKLLIETSRKDEFEFAYSKLCEKLSPCRIMLVGPWPPYSFVSSTGDSVAGMLGAKIIGDDAV